jgi:hypothetical protein
VRLFYSPYFSLIVGPKLGLGTQIGQSLALQKLANESSCHFSAKIAQAKLGPKMRSQVQLGNESKKGFFTFVNYRS